MFFPRTRPLSVREEQLRSLRLSLNTPELIAGELPAGPARAAITLHQEPDGSLVLSVLVRSLGSGTLMGWSWDERVDAGGETRVTEAALSFGESMGFLFDDDAFRATEDDAFAAKALDARRLALDHWWELVGWPTVESGPGVDAAAPIPGIAATVPDSAPAVPHPADDGLPSAKPGGLPPAKRDGLPPAKRDGLPLTKFRRRLGAAPLEAAAAGPKPQASALGRLRLIKKKSEEVGERPPLWLRLLGSF